MEDLDNFNSWRLYHKCTKVDSHELPEIGFVVSDGDLDIAIGFIIKTDTSRCIFAFPVVNPQANKKQRQDGLDLLIKAVVSWQELSGYKSLYSWTNKSKQAQRLIENGFLEYDSNVKHFLG